MSPEAPSTNAEILPPRRLDPRTILVRALQGAPSIILGIPVVLAASRGEAVMLGVLLPALGLLVMISLVSGWLRWRAFTYQILPGQLVITNGLINRTRRSIPAERIQDVSITQGPVARLFGLAQVRVETGGGETDEGRLDSVSLSEAHRLREVLRQIRRRGAPAPDDIADGLKGDEAETVLYRLGPARLLYSGLFRFSLVWLAAIFGVLQYIDQALGYGWDRWLDVLGTTERELQSRLGALTLIVIGGVALALGLIAGVVRTVLHNHGFRLSHAEGRFRFSRGLLTRAEVVVAERQIQLGLIERGAVSGRLGWYAFKVQTLGGSDSPSGRQELVPFATHRELVPIIALAGLPPFERPGLRRVSSLHALTGLLAFVLVPTVTILVATTVSPLALVLLFLMPVPLAVALSRARCHRYGLAETSVQVTRGVLTRRDWTVPYGNVQAVTVRRGPIQRLLGIVSVRIDTAGGRGIHRPYVNDITEAEAAGFVAELIDRCR